MKTTRRQSLIAAALDGVLALRGAVALAGAKFFQTKSVKTTW